MPCECGDILVLRHSRPVFRKNPPTPLIFFYLPSNCHSRSFKTEVYAANSRKQTPHRHRNTLLSVTSRWHFLWSMTQFSRLKSSSIGRPRSCARLFSSCISGVSSPTPNSSPQMRHRRSRIDTCRRILAICAFRRAFFAAFSCFREAGLGNCIMCGDLGGERWRFGWRFVIGG